jgi:hypothetical protein
MNISTNLNELPKITSCGNFLFEGRSVWGFFIKVSEEFITSKHFQRVDPHSLYGCIRSYTPSMIVVYNHNPETDTVLIGLQFPQEDPDLLSLSAEDFTLFQEQYCRYVPDKKYTTKVSWTKDGF